MGKPGSFSAACSPARVSGMRSPFSSSSSSKNASSPLLGGNAGSRKQSFRLSLKVKGRNSSKITSLKKSFSSTLASFTKRARPSKSTTAYMPTTPPSEEERLPSTTELSEDFGETRAASSDTEDESINGAFNTVMAWSCILALAGSMSLLMSDETRLGVSYSAEEEDEEESSQGTVTDVEEGDLFSIPDVDEQDGISLPIMVEDLKLETDTSEVFALGALSFLLGSPVPSAVSKERKQQRPFWDEVDEAMPSMCDDDDDSIPDIGAPDTMSLPSDDDNSLGSSSSDFLEFCQTPDSHVLNEREETDTADMLTFSVLGMFLGAPAPACVSKKSNEVPALPHFEEDDVTMPSIADECSLPEIAQDESSIPEIDEELGTKIETTESAVEDVFKMDDNAAVEEEENKATDTAEVLSMGLLGMFLGSPTPSCVANLSKSKPAPCLFKESDEVMPTIDDSDDERSIPEIEDDSKTSLEQETYLIMPSLSGTSDSDMSSRILPSIVADDADDFFKMDYDVVVEEGENKATNTTEVLSMGLLSMFLGSPAPSCVAKSSKSEHAPSLFKEIDVAMPVIGGNHDDDVCSIPEIEETNSKASSEQDKFFNVPSLSDTSDSDTSREGFPWIIATTNSIEMDDDSAVEEEGNTSTDTAEVLSMGLLGMFLGSPVPSCVAKSSKCKPIPSLFEESDDVMPTIDDEDTKCSISQIEEDDCKASSEQDTFLYQPYLLGTCDSPSSLSIITGTESIEVIDNYDNSPVSIKGMQDCKEPLMSQSPTGVTYSTAAAILPPPPLFFC